MISADSHTSLVKKRAAEAGFMHCGIAAAIPLEDDARRLESWLKQGFHGTMGYMENHFDLRTNPALLVPGARSVITLLYNYYPSATQSAEAPKIARYAFGEDYHKVIRKKLKQLMKTLQTEIGHFDGRGFVDSAPVLERSWALRSGLGWIGRNGNLINPKMGSYFFIATLITDLALVPDDPFAGDYCGTCTRCIDACPTQAILPDKVIDGSRCISHYTIELKEALLPAGAPADKFQNWMFGCDVCQEVCPWNRFSTPHGEPAFEALPWILNMSRAEWMDLSETQFAERFSRSPLKRTGWEGIRRNLKLTQNEPD